MTDGSSFYGTPTVSGRRDVRVAVTVILVVVVGIALAVAKPWGDTGRVAASTEPGVAAASSSAAPTTAIASQVPTAAVSTHLAPPLSGDITAPSPGSAAWGALVWRRLAPGDPLGAVRREVTVGGESVALADIAGSASTAVWSSTDATHWQPVESGTSTTFWPNLNIISLSTLRGRFVAVSEMNDYLTRYLPPVVAWTSSDGRSWAPASTIPVDPVSRPVDAAALVAAGPNRLVIATSGVAARFATSSDGSHWVLSPRNAFPADFLLDDLEATSTGYVAIGGWMKGTAPTRAAALWSADGRHWPNTPTLLPSFASGSDTPVFSSAVTLAVGDHGMVASGIGSSSDPGLWWESPDGRDWQALQTFGPPGGMTCGGAKCGVQPSLAVIGDGHRLFAWSGGAEATASVSSDGKRWTVLHLTGDVPEAQATEATLLPGGVLLTDGATSWFGRAEGR